MAQLPATLVALVAGTCGPALGCKTPPKEAHDAPVAPAPRASASEHGSVPAVPPASSGACTKDEDCRTFSSYCAEAPCACRVLASSDPEPKCLGAAPPAVRCFADPCMNKVARCQGSSCVLTPKG